MVHRLLGLSNYSYIHLPSSGVSTAAEYFIMAEEANPELETFRKQWREEVTARSKGASGHQHIKPTRPAPAKSASQSKVSGPPLAIRALKNEEHESAEDALAPSDHDLNNKDDAMRLGDTGEGIYPSNDSNPEPRSALEHFETAVEKEAQGNLGDSLNHYRKAYRVIPPSSVLKIIADTSPIARRGSGQGVQEQILPSFINSFETSKPQSCQLFSHCTEHCPSFPRWTHLFDHIPADSLLLRPWHFTYSTSHRTLSTTSLSNSYRTLGDID